MGPTNRIHGLVCFTALMAAGCGMGGASDIKADALNQAAGELNASAGAKQAAKLFLERSQREWTPTLLARCASQGVTPRFTLSVTDDSHGPKISVTTVGGDGVDMEWTKEGITVEPIVSHPGTEFIARFQLGGVDYALNAYEYAGTLESDDGAPVPIRCLMPL